MGILERVVGCLEKYVSVLEKYVSVKERQIALDESYTDSGWADIPDPVVACTPEPQEKVSTATEQELGLMRQLPAPEPILEVQLKEVDWESCTKEELEKIEAEGLERPLILREIAKLEVLVHKGARGKTIMRILAVARRGRSEPGDSPPEVKREEIAGVAQTVEEVTSGANPVELDDLMEALKALSKLTSEVKAIEFFTSIKTKEERISGMSPETISGYLKQVNEKIEQGGN